MNQLHLEKKTEGRCDYRDYSHREASPEQYTVQKNLSETMKKFVLLRKGNLFYFLLWFFIHFMPKNKNTSRNTSSIHMLLTQTRHKKKKKAKNFLLSLAPLFHSLPPSMLSQ
jgi:hypothetical protein